MCLVSKNDVVRVIRLLRRRKAPGLDVITSHYLQALLIEHMTLSFQMCIDTGQVSNFLGSGTIKNIKKRENAYFCSSYHAATAISNVENPPADPCPLLPLKQHWQTEL